MINEKTVAQREEFEAWMGKQPQRDNKNKKYKQSSIKGALNCLQNGLKKLGIEQYADVDCFVITDPHAFAHIYKASYTKAEESDRKNGHSDFRNGLDYYMRFLNEKNGTNIVPIDFFGDKIKIIIDNYKSDFASMDKAERYKWEAVGWYKSNWDINATDFAGMVERAFGKTANILESQNYFAYKMLVEYAKHDPERVRSLFKELYNEDEPLENRFIAFRKGFDEYIKSDASGDKKNHYQDLHAVSVYLFFEYPEKYYIYKYSMYIAVKKLIRFEEVVVNSKTKDMENCCHVCELILRNVKNDPELMQMSRDRLTADCYQDEAYHLLAMDIAYYCMVNEKRLNLANGSKTDGTYWPSLDIYDPKMTKEKWKDALGDSLLTNKDALLMLKYMLKEGGESTCANLAKKYGKDAQHYNSVGTNWGRKIKEKYNCPDCVETTQDGEKIRLFVIPFVGRYVKNEKERTRYSWKLRNELKEALEEMDLDKIYKKDVTDVKLNTILYGPPGTGKTYHTVNYAVAVIENKKLAEVKSENYEVVFSRYKNYKKEGKIAFVTFHQSYGYEEFIEGIKPIPILEGEADEGDIRYEVVSGVFKSFCENAQRVATVDNVKSIGLNKNPTVWKVSLEKTGDNPTRSECLANGHIRVGWDVYGKDISDELDYNKAGGKKPLNAFVNRMQIGDIVLSCYTESTVDAIGVVSGEYEWCEEYEKYKRVRKVNWLVKNIRENILDINDGRAMTLSAVYRMTNVAVNDVLKIVEKYGEVKEPKEEKSNYVFIIDEINRGNISKIFGELITLIEPSKRVGEKEETEVILPYSAKPFGVPSNVYVIGTMNTADRSIATVDTALRRRFNFKEILPDPDVLKDIAVDDVSISGLLARINKRICVLYDREHMIGHSYFIGLKEDCSIENLANIFKNNIIPLLQEYFYDDYEKIRLVLGDNGKEDKNTQFIIAKQNDYAELFKNADVGLDEGFDYEINEKAFENIDAYRLI